MIRFLLISMVVIPLIAGCKNKEQCEKARMDVENAWAQVRESATKRKLSGVNVADWTEVERKAETLESSFMTRQVTWNSADSARERITQKLPSLRAEREAEAQGFRLAVADAVKRQQAYERQCR